MRVRSLSVFLLAACFAVGVYGQTTVPTPGAKGYMIGPGDEVSGKVLGEPQFDFEATVDSDGRIAIPFVEEPLMAKCKTEREIRTEITALLAKYLKTPQVNFRVTKRNSRPPISIYGEVRSQSQFDPTRRVYLLEVISHAGGVTEKSGGMVQVFRPRPPVCVEPGQAEWGPTGNTEGLDVPHRMYSLTSLRQGKEESNPEILPGDIIIVPKAAPVYVTGEVIKPGELDIPEGGLPLMQAIAMASGPTREAKEKGIKIYRRKPGATEPQVIEANLKLIKEGEQKDIMLEPFDIVEVGKSKKSIGDILLEVVTGLPNKIPIPIRPI